MVDNKFGVELALAVAILGTLKYNISNEFVYRRELQVEEQVEFELLFASMVCFRQCFFFNGL